MSPQKRKVSLISPTASINYQRSNVYAIELCHLREHYHTCREYLGGMESKCRSRVRRWMSGKLGKKVVEFLSEASPIVKERYSSTVFNIE